MGRWRLPRSIVSASFRRLTRWRATYAPRSPARASKSCLSASGDAERAGRLTGPHRDPFDRMLIAQALAHELVIVSNERVFDSYGVNRLW